jgi:hypothetical protein
MSLSPSARLQPEAGFFPFSVAAVSAKLLPGYAESGGYTERKKYRAQNKVIGNPGGACAEESQGSEQNKVARLGVHSRPRLKGAATRLPLFARVDGLEPPL